MMDQKKIIQVKSAMSISDVSDMKKVSKAMNAIERQPLLYHLWAAEPNPQKVAFAIAYHETAILLKFFVENDPVRAYHTQINAEVWHDSCVEFFVSFDEGIYYYNIEFSCIGTARVGYGRTSTDRLLLDSEVISRINYLAELSSERGKNSHWEITLYIPISLFKFHDHRSLAGQRLKANFFKCGDATPHPHFIAWSNIESANPNFHLPEFFGDLHFE